MNAAIELKNISKSFGSIVANKDVCLTVNRGEILSILGENGSGKTTLMNMIAGIYYPDHGQIFIDGKEVVIRSPKDALDYKIGMVHQHFKLVDVFSATENIILGLDEGKFNVKKSAERIKKISEQYGFDIDPNKKIYARFRSPENAILYLKTLLKLHPHIKFINFRDAIFNMFPDWFDKFIELYKQEIHLPCTGNIRFDILTEDTVRRMKEAGFYTIDMGLESGDQEIRFKYLKRFQTDEMIINCSNWFHKYGIAQLT